MQDILGQSVEIHRERHLIREHLLWRRSRELDDAAVQIKGNDIAIFASGELEAAAAAYHPRGK